MKAQELKSWILSCVQDIEFLYQGRHGAICTFSENDFVAGFDRESHSYDNVESLMADKIFNGMSLNQIAEKLEFV